MSSKSESPAAEQILREIGLPNLPEQWDIVRIDDLLASDRGISVGVMYPGAHDPNGVPLIKAGDLSANEVPRKIESRITPEKHKEYRRTELVGNEILISLVGDVGRCAVTHSSVAGWNVARAIAVLRLLDPTDVQFVRTCLLSAPLRHLMRAWSTTTVQATLNLKEIRQIPLPWPERQERQAISAIINSLDNRFGLVREQNETLEAIARAIFKAWFVDFEPVRAKAEGRQPDGMDEATAALFPSEFQDSELGPIPQGWDVRSFFECVNVVGGGTPKTAISEYWGGEIPWFSVVDAPSDSDVFVIETEKKITESGLANSSATLLPFGATIISARGTVGRVALAGVPITTNQSCYGLSPKALGDYGTYFLTRQVVGLLKQQAHGSVFDTITRDSLKAIKVAVPVAQALSQAFEETVSPLLTAVLNNCKQRVALAELRDTLLPRLISGKIRIKSAEQLVEEAI